MTRWSLAMLALFAVLSLPAASRADVPPPSGCTVAGAPCTNAGDRADQPGVCTASKCSKALPAPGGGLKTFEYDCTLCVATGARASASAPSAAPSPSTSAAPASPPGKRGCAAREGRPDRASLVVFAAACAALALARRRAGARRDR